MVHQYLHAAAIAALMLIATSAPLIASQEYYPENRGTDEQARSLSQCICNVTNSKLLGISSKLDGVFSKVCVVDSKVENLTNVFGQASVSLFERIDSFLEIISNFTIGDINSRLDVVESKVDEIDQNIVDSISKMSAIESKTDACCDLTQSTLISIDSKVDDIDSTTANTTSVIAVIESKVDDADADILDTSSLLSVLESKTDACCELTQSKLNVIDSKVDDVDNDVLQTLSAADVIESKVDDLNADVLQTMSLVAVAESKTDACCELTQSKLNVIDSKVDNLDINVLETLSTADVIESKVDDLNADILQTMSATAVLESKTDACCTLTQSKLTVIESKVDDVDNKVLETLSTAEVIESKVDDLNADVLQTMSLVAIIESKTDACCALTQSKLNIIDSKVDDVDNDVLETLSKVVVIDSKVDNLNADVLQTMSATAVLESKTDACCELTQSKLNVINSKIDTIGALALETLSKAIIIDSKVDDLDADVLQTMSLIAVIESKTDSCCEVIQSNLDTISSKVDDIDVDVLLTLSKLATLESKTDSCCEVINSKLDFENSVISVVDSKVDSLGACDPEGFMGGTISAPGTYCLATDLSGTGPLITIAASQVVLDLNGHTLTPTGDAIAFDATTTRTDVSISNGFLVGDGTGIGLSLPTSANLYVDIKAFGLDIKGFATGIEANDVRLLNIKNVTVTENATNMVIGTSNDITLLGSVMSSSTTNQGTSINDCNDIVIKRCLFDTNRDEGLILSGSRNIAIQSCTMNNNNASLGTAAGTLITGDSSNIFIKDCHFNNATNTQTYGIQIGTSSDISIENSVFYRNNDNGVHMELSGGAPSFVDMLKCEACSNGINGFELHGSEILLRSCFAFQNTDNGFLALSPLSKLCIIDCTAAENDVGFFLNDGGGLIKENIAIENSSCGFNDTAGSLTDYAYVANTGSGNGGSPAGSPNDSNYCRTTIGNPFDGTGPGAAPYYEFSRTATAKSYWDNITLP